MKKSKLKRLLAGAVDAARLAGKLMRKNLRAVKKVNAATQNDIKLELDVRCQKTIEKCLLKAFPKIPIFGEEGICGPQEGEFRWVVDPIDGTVNYACGIPHACVSIALQRVSQEDPHSSAGIVVGVVYDPFLDELWTAVEGGPARLNGRKIHVSERRSLDEAILITGFAKEGKNLPVNLKLFEAFLPKVRKIRIMGSAALALTYVASGRFDGYMESGLHLWDLAAGRLILECAGGVYLDRPFGEHPAYELIATNKNTAHKIQTVVTQAWGGEFARG